MIPPHTFLYLLNNFSNASNTLTLISGILTLRNNHHPHPLAIPKRSVSHFCIFTQNNFFQCLAECKYLCLNYSNRFWNNDHFQRFVEEEGAFGNGGELG